MHPSTFTRLFNPVLQVVTLRLGDAQNSPALLSQKEPPQTRGRGHRAGGEQDSPGALGGAGGLSPPFWRAVLAIWGHSSSMLPPGRDLTQTRACSREPSPGAPGAPDPPRSERPSPSLCRGVPQGQAEAGPGLPELWAGPGLVPGVTHSFPRASAACPVVQKMMAFTTSPEPSTGTGRCGDLWILHFHQYCIRHTAPPSPARGRTADTLPSRGAKPASVRQAAWEGDMPATGDGLAPSAALGAERCRREAPVLSLSPTSSLSALQTQQ